MLSNTPAQYQLLGANRGEKAGVSQRGRGWLRASGEEFWSSTVGLLMPTYLPTYRAVQHTNTGPG